MINSQIGFFATNYSPVIDNGYPIWSTVPYPITQFFTEFSDSSKFETFTTSTQVKTQYSSSSLVDTKQIVVPSGKVWIVHIDKIYEYDTSDDSITEVVDFDGDGTAVNMSGVVLAPNGYVYIIPYDTISGVFKFIKINTSDYTYSTINVTPTSSTDIIFGGVIAPNGKIYGICYRGTTVIVMDTNDDSDSKINISNTYDLAYSGPCIGKDGNVYCPPFNSRYVLKINTSNDTHSYFSTDLGSGYKWWHSTLAPNGKIYGSPRNATTIIEIDTDNSTTRLINNSYSASNGYRGVNIGPDGLVYITPWRASNLLKLDPSDDSITEISFNKSYDTTYGQVTGDGFLVITSQRDVHKIGAGGGSQGLNRSLSVVNNHI